MALLLQYAASVFGFLSLSLLWHQLFWSLIWSLDKVDVERQHGEKAALCGG